MSLGERTHLIGRLTKSKLVSKKPRHPITGFVRNSAYSQKPTGGKKSADMKKMILRTLTSFNTNLRNSAKQAPSLRGSFFIILVIGCFPLLPRVQATRENDATAPDLPAKVNRRVIRMQATPGRAPSAPETALAGFNTADGDHALFSIITGVANSAFGWYSLFSNTDGSFNTGLGGGTLVLNNGSSNTAVGTAALLLNTTGFENTAVGTDALDCNDVGSQNTAIGTFALFSNTAGIGDTAIGWNALTNENGVGANTAVGWEALVANTTGFSNAAFGVSALQSNIDGVANTALGNRALDAVDHGSENTAVGRHAGDFITSGDSNVCLGTFSGTAITTGSGIITIGPVSGVHSIFGQVDDRTYIANILDAAVDAGTAQAVYVDADGRLGTFLAAGGPEPRLPRPATPKADPDAQAMLNRKVEALEATVAELRAQLKEQAAQIQKVSAQLEVSMPAAQVVRSGQ
jgi:hypothetical protein